MPPEKEDGQNSLALMMEQRMQVKSLMRFLEEWQETDGFNDQLKEASRITGEITNDKLCDFVKALKNTGILEKYPRIKNAVDILDGPGEKREGWSYLYWIRDNKEDLEEIKDQIEWLKDRRDTIAKDDLVMVPKEKWNTLSNASKDLEELKAEVKKIKSWLIKAAIVFAGGGSAGGGITKYLELW